jgi:hypothetical protein
VNFKQAFRIGELNYLKEIDRHQELLGQGTLSNRPGLEAYSEIQSLLQVFKPDTK